MAIKVQNNGGIGNPYHSEKTGEFVSAEYASGTMKPGDVKNYDKESDSFDDDIDWDDLFSEGDPNDELVIYWNNKQKGIVPKKNIEEMTNQEMIEEINECKKFAEENGVVFTNFDKIFNGDLKLKCANLRKLKSLMQEYPIPFENFEISSDFLGIGGVWANTISVDFKYDKFYPEDFDLEKMKINLGIKFNNTIFTNYFYVKREERAEINKGMFVDANEDEEASQALTHEYGHVVQTYIMQKTGRIQQIKDEVKNKNFRAFPPYLSAKLEIEEFTKKWYNSIKEIKNEIELFYNKQTGGNHFSFISETSKYGKTEASEFFAETFCSLMCGRPNKVALAMKEYLKQFF